MSPLEVGLVGAGGMAGVHLPAWVELGARVRVFSIDGQAPGLAERYGATAVGSLVELLDGCDVVDVCTPTFTHKEIGLAAIAAGKHVVCEKPLALTGPDAAEMVRWARRRCCVSPVPAPTRCGRRGSPTRRCPAASWWTR
jgi:predicted dehydrogenase